MPRRLIATLIVVPIIGLFAYTVLFNPNASASPQELNVVSRTRGNEVLTADVLDNQVRISLKNNHKDTITAFAISFRDTTIKEDFAYSDVHFGIEPGDTFTKSYRLSPTRSELPPLYLLTVLLKNGTKDGDSKVGQEIKDERLGEKIQILRTLRILEKDGQSRKDLRITKSDIVAALNTDESETLVILNELQPTSRSDDKLSDDLRNGLQVGREKMLQRFEVLQELPAEYREKGFKELRDRSRKLFAKL
jgi:hypothetical protein